MPIQLNGYVDPNTGVEIPWWTVGYDQLERWGPQLSNGLIVPTWQFVARGYHSKTLWLSGVQPVSQVSNYLSTAQYWPYLNKTTASDFPIGTQYGTLLSFLQTGFDTAVADPVIGVPPFAGGTVVQATTFKAGTSPGTGNFTVAHNLGYTPSGCFIINRDPNAPQGLVSWQSSPRFDGTNFYLSATAVGLPYLVEVWQ